MSVRPVREHCTGLDEQRAAAPVPGPDRHCPVELDPQGSGALIRFAAGRDLVPGPLSATAFSGQNWTARGGDGHERHYRTPRTLAGFEANPPSASWPARLLRNGIGRPPSAAGNINDPGLASSPRSVAEAGQPACGRPVQGRCHSRHAVAASPGETWSRYWRSLGSAHIRSTTADAGFGRPGIRWPGVGLAMSDGTGKCWRASIDRGAGRRTRSVRRRGHA